MRNSSMTNAVYAVRLFAKKHKERCKTVREAEKAFDRFRTKSFVLLFDAAFA